MYMRALFASVLMALALLWVSATGGRAPRPLLHFPAQALSPFAPSPPIATFTPSGQQARLLLTSGRPARPPAGGPPPALLLPAPLPRLSPGAQPVEYLASRCAPARGARLLPHGPRAPPA